MDPQKTTAIILRVVEFSETSCIVTMFTRNLGKITAIAKGARRPKGPFEAAIDVLAICRIVFLHKTNGSMDLLTEAKLERRFRSSSRDLQRLYCGYYIVELLRTLTDDADAHPEVFDMAIDALEKIDGDGELSQTVFDFESGILKWLGHAPMLTRCVTCGINKTSIDRVHFGLSDGGLLCNECSRGKEAIRILNSDSLQLLMDQFDVQLETNGLEADETIPVLTNSVLTEEDRNDLSVKEDASVYTESLKSRKGYMQARQLMNQYMNHLVGHQIRLQKYIENL